MNDTNTIQFNQPNHLISLASSAFIVNVEVNVWSATKQDKGISDEVTTAYKADKNAGKFVKNLLAGDPTHKEILNHRQSVYNWVKRRTYDWSGSSRLLPMHDLIKFKEEYRELEQAHEKLVSAFVDKYPTIVAAMAFKQGDMFDATEYPKEHEVRRRFGMKLFITPVPQNDFRNAIAEEIAADLESHYEREASEKVQEVMRDAAERLVEFVKRIAHACREVEPETNGKVRRPKVYEATINQAKEMCDLLQHFNLTKDAKLEAMRKEVKDVIGSLSADVLRESDSLRVAVKTDLDKIMSKFGV
jgi:hypothetical protein